ncbi:MAG: DUF4878 domain-containing protein [Acidobacteriota bacterium]|nr:MAG: DUF4878 domain-containing protein [Acidobacteriota bacterium]
MRACYLNKFFVCGLICLLFAACGSREPATPVETFKTYVKALKAKDPKAIKTLLSEATLKMHEEQAKAQNTTIDDVLQRETLVGPNQTTVEFRNEKIDGEKATIEVKNSFGTWETVPFVFEKGQWRIDKQGFAQQMLDAMDESNRRLNEIINGNTQPAY